MTHFYSLLSRTLIAAGLIFAVSAAALAGNPDFVPCDVDTQCDDDNVCTADRCFIVPSAECGDVDASGAITAADALHALRYATGLPSDCSPARCDVDMSGAVTATDALRLIRSAIGLASGLVCTGECVFESIACDDGLACNGVETCDPREGCVDGAPLDCNDDSQCTSDSCDDASGCSHEAISCDDGNPCNGEEFCMPELGCVVTQGLMCDDDDPCTVDSCDEEQGCSHEPINCGDGNACNGEERCDSLLGCVDGDPLQCDDGNVCNGSEECDPVQGCMAGQDVDCADSDACNGTEVCDPEQGCVDGPGLDCDDGNDCTVDSCDSTDGCMNEGMDCDDGDACTMDTCSDEGGCANEPVNCNDADVCNGEETCDSDLGCVAGTALQCDDGAFCNGLETCDADNGCLMGEAPDCSDEDECTADKCNEEVDACTHDDQGGEMDVISFSGLPAGTILAEVHGDGGNGPVGVHAMNMHLGDANAAVVYDSACSGGECSGKGADLGTPNETFDGPGVGAGGEAGAAFENAEAQGEVLIVAKDLIDVAPADGLVDDPQDQGHLQSVSIHLDFAAIGPVTVKSMRMIDVDANEAAPVVDVYGAGDALLASVVAPVTGDNGTATVDLGNVEGAMWVMVSLFGSGAIDDVAFSTGQCVRETTTTSMMPATTTTTTTTSTTLAPVTTTLPATSTTTMPASSTTTTSMHRYSTTSTLPALLDGLRW